VPMGQKQ